MNFTKKLLKILKKNIALYVTYMNHFYFLDLVFFSVISL